MSRLMTVVFTAAHSVVHQHMQHQSYWVTKHMALKLTFGACKLKYLKLYLNAPPLFSSGVNMYAMLTGCLPYTVEPFNITALHAKILENKMNPIPETISTGILIIINIMSIHTVVMIIVISYIANSLWKPSPSTSHSKPRKQDYYGAAVSRPVA